MKQLLFGLGIAALLAGGSAAAQPPSGSLGPPASSGPPANLNFQPPPSGPPVPVDTPPNNYPLLPPPNNYPTVPFHSPGVVLEETPGRAWVSMDYLLWWVKPGPSPGPLVTLGSASDAIPGALGQPNTQVLFGEHNIDFGALSGFRLNTGCWLPCCPVLGFEAGFFILQNATVKFSAFSDDNGTPIVARPFINAQTGTESSYVDSYPGAASGGVTTRFTSQLDSWELNMAVNMLRCRNVQWDLLAGFRAVDLVEDFQIRDIMFPLVAGDFTILGSPADPPGTLADFDHFHTTNHFYGGQLGSRLNWCYGRLDLNWTAKVALGATQQSITVDGGSLFVNPGSPTITAPGGIAALPTNMGRASRSIFTVVPETGLNMTYQFTPWCSLQFGYTFLYWSNVVRPGNQVDRTINPSQVPTDQGFGALTGPARPALTPQTGDFWTQGVNFGLVFHF